jgi:ABC-type Zn uptake system ZnuABC Zn-binding protein ZnuA
VRPLGAALFVLVLVLAFAGCGDDGDEGGGEGATSVVATTTQLGDFARQVAGERADVSQILGPNVDPHDYEPRPSDVRELERADVVLRSGGEVDEWLSELIESSGTRADRIELAKVVSRRKGDPHWWHDVGNAIRAVAAIERALAKADPDGRSVYAQNAAAYVARLRILHREVARCIGVLPRSARKLVTTHDAFGYYADRYGLEVIGAVIPSLSSQAQPSSKGVGELVGQIRREDVKAIFPESSLNTKLEDRVSRESGAKVAGGLWADTLGPEGSPGARYIDAISSNTAEIVEGLSGAEVHCKPRL